MNPCKYEWLEEFLKLPEGIPCADTFRNHMLTILAAYLYDNHDASKASCQ